MRGGRGGKVGGWVGGVKSKVGSRSAFCEEFG